MGDELPLQKSFKFFLTRDFADFDDMWKRRGYLLNKSAISR